MTDLAISAVRAFPLTARMAAGTRTSQGDYGAVSIVLVEVTTADGITGYGECLARFGVHAYAALVERLLAPLLLGESAFDIQRHARRMRRALSGRSGGMLVEAIAGIDIALWDCVGKALGAPVHRLLGGEGRTHLDCYASSVNWADAARMEAEARAALAMGFRAMKVKLGAPADTAIERARRVREVCGPDIRLGADANWAWDLDDAVRVGRALAELDYWFLEEPIAPEDLAGYAHLRRTVPIRLAAGESDYTVHHAAELLRDRLVGLIQPDVARAGGISGTRDIATLAHGFHVGYAPHVGWSGAVCVAASLQLGAAMPAFASFECMVPANPLRQSLTTVEVGAAGSLVDGRVVVPDGPGLGIEIDWDAVQRFRAEP
jgi:D-galactarolactone cycloisomerase